MTTARSRSLVLLLTAIFIAALSVIGTPPASAAPACYNGTCRGIDPNTPGLTNYSGAACSAGVYNKAEFTSAGFRVELRYSPNCMATWTRITTLSNAYPTACQGTYAQIHTYTPQRVYAYTAVTSASCGTGAASWTAMSPFDGVLVRACTSPLQGYSPPTSQSTCTGYY